MPSQRTLGPGGKFSPKKLKGLALWLDASDTSSLWTTDAGAVTPVNDPRDITGCVLWLDGADSSSTGMTLNGSLVETWKDKSGGGRDFTASGTARPTLTPSAINSRSAVTFNGSSTTMAGNAAAESVIRNLAGYTIFTAVRTASVAGGERFAFGVGSTILVRTGQQDSRPLIAGRRLYADTLKSITDGSGTLTTGTAFIQTAVVNHSSQSLTGVRNGLVFATDATYMAAGTSQNNDAPTSVGTQGGGTYGFWNGEIAEIIVFNTALSTANRARVEAYLAQRWGISGVHLPVPPQPTAVRSPMEIGGCAGWWDCSRTDRMWNATTGGSLVANGGAVLRLEDLSGNGKHLVQATSASAPSRQDGAKNGLPALNFAGTKTLAAGAAGDWNFLHNTQGGTVIAVIKPFDTADPNTFAYGVATNIGGATTGVGWSLFFDDRVSYPRNNHVSHSVTAGVSQQTVISQEQNNALPSANDFSLLSFTPFAGSSTTAGRGGVYVSGNATGNANDSTLAPSASNSLHPLTVGSAFGANSIAGLAELIVFNTVLSAVDRERVEKYLQNKWATPVTRVPVGYWGDRSGNSRHFTQPDSASRPTVGLTSQNGRQTLAFDGTSSWMRMERTTFAARSVFTVFRRTGTATLYSSPFGKQSNVAAGYGGSAYQVAYGNEGGWSVTDSTTQKLWYTSNGSPHKLSAAYMRGAAMPLADAQNYQTGIAAAPNTTDAELLYAEAATDTDGNQAWFLGTEPFATTRKYPANLLEVLIYNRALTAAERQRVERYLAARWGIPLLPQASNADAQDWIVRVYANGGTVTQATANSVSAFCDAIDAAGLRTKFYRLNLFAGNSDGSLIAVRTPLYRGQSRTGLQYGGATDSNVNFAPTDYSETTGLTGSSTTGKYLNTGFPANTLASDNIHLAAGVLTSSPSANVPSNLIGVTIQNGGDNTCLADKTVSGSGVGVAQFGKVGGAYAGSTGPITEGAWVMTYPHVFRNGNIQSPSATTFTTPASTAPHFVFGINSTGTVGGGPTGSRLGWYSIGTKFGNYNQVGSSSTDEVAFREALATFQEDIGRS
jgi:hypothetical protein